MTAGTNGLSEIWTTAPGDPDVPRNKDVWDPLPATNPHVTFPKDDGSINFGVVKASIPAAVIM